MIKSNDSWCKNHLCLVGKDIYESHRFNEVLCLEEECISIARKGYSPEHEGTVNYGMGRKRWIWKACLEVFLCRQLCHTLPGKLGWGCLLAWGSTHSSCEPSRNAQAPAPTGGPEPQPLSCSWGTFCWGCAAPWIARGCCRELSCLELRALQARWKRDIRAPSAIQHGSEKQTWGV